MNIRTAAYLMYWIVLASLSKNHLKVVQVLKISDFNKKQTKEIPTLQLMHYDGLRVGIFSLRKNFLCSVNSDL